MRSRVLGSLEWLGVPLALVLAGECTIGAAEKTAAELFPPTTVGYLEVPQPSKLVGLALDQPLVKEIANQPAYQKALQGRQYQQVQAVLKVVEEKLGMNWRRAVASLTDGGLSVGFDLPTQGIAALAQAADESLALKARDAVLELARADAAAKGRPDPVQKDDVRGVIVYQLGDVHFAVLGKWLLATNKRLLLAMVLENYLGNNTSLGSNEQFQAVRKDRPDQPAAWLYVDLRLIRLTGMLKAALNKKRATILRSSCSSGEFSARCPMLPTSRRPSNWIHLASSSRPRCLPIRERSPNRENSILAPKGMARRRLSCGHENRC